MTETERDMFMKYIAVLILDSRNKDLWALGGIGVPTELLAEEGQNLRDALDITVDEQGKFIKQIEQKLKDSINNKESGTI